MNHLWHDVFAAGFFASSTVRDAALVGALVALVTGAVGVFTVMRGLAFAGHALGEVGSTGGSAAFLAGGNPLWGFLGIAVVAAGFIELLGARRPRSRDLATGLVLGAGLGLAALFLYLDTTSSSSTGVSATILFGSLFLVSTSLLPAVAALSSLSLGCVVICYRMLLLSSLSPDLAAARRVPVRLVGVCYLLALAIAVSLSADTIGAVLGTALLIGPPATAVRLTRRPGLAVATAGAVGVLAVWLGILLAYDSYYWPPVGHGWPVSFFIVILIFVFYLLTDLGVGALRRPRRQPVVSESAAR
jgi:zinc/manganese transport system permease protein